MNESPPPGQRFLRFAEPLRARIEQELERLLPATDTPPARLHAAMRHAMFPGGKRVRPLLALLACRVSGGDAERALRPAAGLECLHTYSLVHDDLPCMDDDDLRRGRPTVHRAFDEATAVLVGDALLTLAFEAVADGGAEAVAALARAAGSLGMVGGQAADMEAEGEPASGRTRAEVEWIHDRKTAVLIAASMEVGVLAGGGAREALEPTRRYGLLLGRAFQIADDCLDRTGDARSLGKRPGQDESAGKLTFPAVVGLAASLAEADRLATQAAALAAAVCAPAGREQDAVLLEDLAHYVVARRA